MRSAVPGVSRVDSQVPHFDTATGNETDVEIFDIARDVFRHPVVFV